MHDPPGQPDEAGQQVAAVDRVGVAGDGREALELAEPGQINQIYFSLSIGATDVDANFYGRMFSALEPFVESGRLEYKTLNEIYHLYQNEES